MKAMFEEAPILLVAVKCSPSVKMLLDPRKSTRAPHCSDFKTRRASDTFQPKSHSSCASGNGVNTNKTADDNTDQHGFSQLLQYLLSHLGTSGISPKMSSVFNEALERASNPKMPPPKSPIRTPTSPSRTSSMFQGKIKETVITIPGMQNAISHLQIHAKPSQPVPALTH
jgi:hypothetical protein